MPVVARGRQIVEKATGKVVAHGKTAASAKSSARARNAALHGWKPTKRKKKRTVREELERQYEKHNA